MNFLGAIKDAEDLIQLIIINRLDLNEPEIQATILKHGDHELYDKLRRSYVPE